MADFHNETSVLKAAVHMLHEQAHGGVFRVCAQEPCRGLHDLYAPGVPAMAPVGPAPSTLPHLGGDR